MHNITLTLIERKAADLLPLCFICEAAVIKHLTAEERGISASQTAESVAECISSQVSVPLCIHITSSTMSEMSPVNDQETGEERAKEEQWSKITKRLVEEIRRRCEVRNRENREISCLIIAAGGCKWLCCSFLSQRCHGNRLDGHRIAEKSVSKGLEVVRDD